MSEPEALLAIQELMDGVEWSAETLDDIAQVMEQVGYPIKGLDE